MKRRAFIKQMLAMGLMTPSLNAAALHLITAKLEINSAAFAVETMPILEYENVDAVIKVIGVGGFGCNALNVMIDKGVYSAEYIAVDGDLSALKGCKPLTHLQIDVADDIDTERARIARLINDANMIFIVAGMDGETDTATSSLLAQIARELNILTIGVVTSLSGCEESQMQCAIEGMNVLRENVDSLIVVPIDGLMKIHGITISEAFVRACGVMRDAVACISEIVNFPGLIAVDFCDVRTVMSEKGIAMIGTAVAAGPERARFAAKRAIASPLFENMNLSDALGMVVTITSTSSLKLTEIDEIMACVHYVADDATVVLGSVFDESMGDKIRVTVIATGLGLPKSVYREQRAARLAELNKWNEWLEKSAVGNYEVSPKNSPPMGK